MATNANGSDRQQQATRNLASALQECFNVASSIAGERFEKLEQGMGERLGKQDGTLRLIWRQVGGSRMKHLPIDD